MISILIRLGFLFVIPYCFFSVAIHWGSITIDQTMSQQLNKTEQISASMIAFVIDSSSIESKDSMLLSRFTMSTFSDRRQVNTDSFLIILEKTDSANYSLVYNSMRTPDELFIIRWLLLDHSWGDSVLNAPPKPQVSASSSFNFMQMMGELVEQYTQAINFIFNILFLLLVFWPVQKLSLRKALSFRSFLWQSTLLMTLSIIFIFGGYYLAISSQHEGLINSLLFTLTNNFHWTWALFHFLIFFPFLLIYIAMIWPNNLEKKDRYHTHTRQYWLSVFWILLLIGLPALTPDSTAWSIPFLGALGASDQLFANEFLWLDSLKMFSLNIILSLLIVYLILRLKRSLR